MNIIIPLCGKGERFSKKGFKETKALIKVFGKEIIRHVIDSLKLTSDDKLYVIINDRVEATGISKYLDDATIINIHKETSGASETIVAGLAGRGLTGPTLLVDGDNFYRADIISLIKKNIDKNQVVCFETDGLEAPVFSYIETIDDDVIVYIKEKEKISKLANTGAYFFSSAKELQSYAYKVLTSKNTVLPEPDTNYGTWHSAKLPVLPEPDTNYGIRHSAKHSAQLNFLPEPYISCIIDKMIEDDKYLKATKIKNEEYFSLGTPEQVEYYTKNTHVFLFDLDGTLVHSDHIYYKVWKDILETYSIYINEDIYKTYIYSNSDDVVKLKLLPNINVTLEDIAKKKSEYFIKYINDVSILEGANIFLEKLYTAGHRIAVVTNSNKTIAEAVIKQVGFDKYVDFIISGEECENAKPHSDPYFKAIEKYNTNSNKVTIFEDSFNGLLSARGVNPTCIVGIGSNKDTLLSAGAHVVYQNYTSISIEDVIISHAKTINYTKDITRCLQYRYPTVENVKIDPIQLKGGFIADVIAVTFDVDSITHRAVMKVENENDSPLNKMAHFLQLYDREYYFYESIAPYVPIHIPKYYGIIRDSSMKRIGILLEDLRDENTVLNLNLVSEPISTSLTLIANMAKLHATFWNKLDGKFSLLRKHNDPVFQPTWSNFLKERIDLFTDKWKFILNDKNTSLAKDITSRFDTIQNELSSGHLTLCHGDIKSPNTFYKGKDKIPYFIDWQYISHGKGVQDLVFFMIESFTPDKIKLLYPIFKHYYYVQLIEYGVKNYTYEEYEKDFINASYYFPFFVAIWFGTVPTDDLIDLNFPYFYIQRLFNFYSLIQA